jgi:3,4-dihydroxy-2-butanone 4-phosphate synthase
VSEAIDRRRLCIAFAVVVLAVAGEARADETRDVRVLDAGSVPKAEVLVIHAKKCDHEHRSIDPKIGEPPNIGYECMTLVGRRMLKIPLNQPVEMELPNKRMFQLQHSAKVDNRYTITASISAADGSNTFQKLADITTEANRTFNVGGFSHQGGVLVLTVRIIP